MRELQNGSGLGPSEGDWFLGGVLRFYGFRCIWVGFWEGFDRFKMEFGLFSCFLEGLTGFYGF